jgi:hypothetical protein
LLAYRNTPHSTTSKAPAEALFNHQPRLKLHQLQPPVRKPSVIKTSDYKVGQAVWAKNYRGGDSWVAGTISKQLSKVVYLVSVGSSIWKRHVGQLKRKVVVEEWHDFGARSPATNNNEQPDLHPPANNNNNQPRSPQRQPRDQQQVQQQPRVSPPRQLRRSERQRKAPNRFHDEYNY